MKQSNNIALVHKFLSGALSDKEIPMYNRWLEEPGNRELADDLAFVWDKSAKYKATSFQPNAAAAFHKFKASIQEETSTVETKVVQLNPMRWVYRIAASFVLVAASVYFFNIDNAVKFDQGTFATSIESKSLLDGSSVWLDANSSLALAESFNADERRVKLEGKAFFDVERNENKPFIVEMGKNTLEVLGTSFNVETKGNTSRVEVRSGKVKVTAKTASMLLVAGDIVNIDFNSDVITKDSEASSDFNWYQQGLELQSQSIQTVIDQISKYYKVNIDLSSNVDKGCKLTSPLAGNSNIEEIMEVLGATYEMKYEKLNKDHYVIKYLNCN